MQYEGLAFIPPTCRYDAPTCAQQQLCMEVFWVYLVTVCFFTAQVAQHCVSNVAAVVRSDVASVSHWASGCSPVLCVQAIIVDRANPGQPDLVCHMACRHHDCAIGNGHVGEWLSVWELFCDCWEAQSVTSAGSGGTPIHTTHRTCIL